MSRTVLVVDDEPTISDAVAARLRGEGYDVVTAAEAVVVEDALSGVRSGAAGDFGLVVGVDRGAGRDELAANGADEVVDDLAELIR